MLFPFRGAVIGANHKICQSELAARRMNALFESKMPVLGAQAPSRDTAGPV